MKMEYSCFVLISIFGILFSSQTGAAVRLTFTPTTLTIGGNAGTNPTSSPQEFVIECDGQGTSGVEGVFYFHLKRGNNRFAEINSITRQPKLSDSAPQDIKTKNPTLQGNVDSAYSASLTVRYRVPTLTCVDDVQYTCEMRYLMTSGESRTVTAQATPNMIFLPGGILISATRTSIAGSQPQPIQNHSTVQYNDEVQYSCTGDIGKQSATLIEWFVYDHLSTMFGKFQPDVGDYIDEGFVNTAVCPYERTTTLRYKINDWYTGNVVFRCQATVTVNGQLQTTYSPEYHVRPPLRTGSTGSAIFSNHVTLLVAAVLGIGTVFIVT